MLSDTKVANRNGRGFGWEIAHAADSRRPPISLYAILSPYSTYACTRTRRKFRICSSSACTSCSHEAPTLVIHLAGGRRLVRRAAGGGQQRRHGAARLHASRFHLALQPHEDTVRHAQRLDDAGALAARCLRPKTPALRACSQTHRPPSNSSPSRCEAFSEKRMAPQTAKVIHPASHPSATAMACLCMPTVATTRPSLRARTSRITRTVAPFTRVVPPVGARKSQVNAAPPLPSAWTARAYTPHISPQCDAPRCTLAFHLRFFQVRHVRNRLGSTYGLTRAQ